MTEAEIKQALSYILYNFCYHHREGDAPLTSEEIEILLLDDEDRKIRRKTYCECLDWAKENQDFDYASVLLEKRKYSSQYIHAFLMQMLDQLKKFGIYEKFDSEK